MFLLVQEGGACFLFECTVKSILCIPTQVVDSRSISTLQMPGYARAPLASTHLCGLCATTRSLGVVNIARWASWGSVQNGLVIAAVASHADTHSATSFSEATSVTLS